MLFQISFDNYVSSLHPRLHDLRASSFSTCNLPYIHARPPLSKPRGRCIRLHRLHQSVIGEHAPRPVDTSLSLDGYHMILRVGCPHAIVQLCMEWIRDRDVLHDERDGNTRLFSFYHRLPDWEISIQTPCSTSNTDLCLLWTSRQIFLLVPSAVRVASATFSKSNTKDNRLRLKALRKGKDP